MAGIASHWQVSATSMTVAGTAVSTTTAATSITVLTTNKDTVQIGIENTTNVQVFISQAPVDRAGVVGTAVYRKAIPAGGYRVLDLKGNGVAFGPSVWGVYAASTPASGIVEIVAVPAR